MQKEEQFRNISVLLSDGVKKLYTDDIGNFEYTDLFIGMHLKK